METLDQLLALMRQIFVGTITRDDILLRSRYVKAFVATAIMQVDDQRYLRDGGVIGSYQEHLFVIAQLGLVNHHRVSDLPDNWFSESKLRVAAARLGLYEKVPGQRRRNVPVHPTPPAELQVLISEFGRTPAIEQFLRDIETAKRKEAEQHDEFMQESRRHVRAAWLNSGLLSGDDFVRGVMELIGSSYDVHVARQLYNRLGELLNNA